MWGRGEGTFLKKGSSPLPHTPVLLIIQRFSTGGEAARREFVPTERRKPSERDGSLFYPGLSVSWKSLSIYILFPILFGEELLEADDCFFDRLDHTGFFNEIGVVDEVGEQGDHDGADEEPLSPPTAAPARWLIQSA